MWLCSSVGGNSQSLLRPCAWNNRPYVWMRQPKWEPKVTWRTWSASGGQRRISRQRRGLWWYTASVAYKYEAGGHTQGGSISNPAFQALPLPDALQMTALPACLKASAADLMQVQMRKCPQTHIHLKSVVLNLQATTPLEVKDPFTGSHIRYAAYQVFILWFIAVAKLQL